MCREFFDPDQPWSLRESSVVARQCAFVHIACNDCSARVEKTRIVDHVVKECTQHRERCNGRLAECAKLFTREELLAHQQQQRCLEFLSSRRINIGKVLTLIHFIAGL